MEMRIRKREDNPALDSRWNDPYYSALRHLPASILLNIDRFIKQSTLDSTHLFDDQHLIRMSGFG